MPAGIAATGALCPREGVRIPSGEELAAAMLDNGHSSSVGIGV